MFGFPYNESGSDGVCTPAAAAGNLDDRAKRGVRDVIMEIAAGRMVHGFVSATGNAALQVQNLTFEALIIEKLPTAAQRIGFDRV